VVETANRVLGQDVVPKNRGGEYRELDTVATIPAAFSPITSPSGVEKVTYIPPFPTTCNEDPGAIAPLTRMLFLGEGPLCTVTMAPVPILVREEKLRMMDSPKEMGVKRKSQRWRSAY